MTTTVSMAHAMADSALFSKAPDQIIISATASSTPTDDTPPRPFRPSRFVEHLEDDSHFDPTALLDSLPLPEISTRLSAPLPKRTRSRSLGSENPLRYRHHLFPRKPIAPSPESRPRASSNASPFFSIGQASHRKPVGLASSSEQDLLNPTWNQPRRQRAQTTQAAESPLLQFPVTAQDASRRKPVGSGDDYEPAPEPLIPRKPLHPSSTPVHAPFTAEPSDLSMPPPSLPDRNSDPPIRRKPLGPSSVTDSPPLPPEIPWLTHPRRSGEHARPSSLSRTNARRSSHARNISTTSIGSSVGGLSGYSVSRGSSSAPEDRDTIPADLRERGASDARRPIVGELAANIADAAKETGAFVDLAVERAREKARDLGVDQAVDRALDKARDLRGRLRRRGDSVVEDGGPTPETA